MRNHKYVHVLIGAFMLAQSHVALAQSVTFQVQNPASVPALGDIGLMLLALLMLAGAFYFHRQARTGARVLSVILGLMGLGLVTAQQGSINVARAFSALTASFDSGSSVVPLDQGVGVYEITNNAGAPIKITGFTGNGEACGSIMNVTFKHGEKVHLAANNILLAQEIPQSQWNICPHGEDFCPGTPIPGCSINSLVQPSGTCYLTLECIDLRG
jgi:hypothetical protein